jgi:hypothetical protein
MSNFNYNPQTKNLNQLVNAFTLHKFIKSITTPFRLMNAYKLGVIDDTGKFLKDPNDYITPYEKLVIRLKVLIDTTCKPIIKSYMKYYATAIDLLAEESVKLYGGDKEMLSEQIRQYLKETAEFEPIGHLQHAGELLYTGGGHHAVEHLKATHEVLTGKARKGHNLSYKADGSMSLLFGKSGGRPFVRYKGKGAQTFYTPEEVKEYAAREGKPHYVAPFTAALQAASHERIDPDVSYQADAILDSGEGTLKGNLIHYKRPSKSTTSMLAVHGRFDSRTGKRLEAVPDVSFLNTKTQHFPVLSLKGAPKLGLKERRAMRSHISTAGKRLKRKDVQALVGEIATHTDPSTVNKAATRAGHMTMFSNAVQRGEHARTVQGYLDFTQGRMQRALEGRKNSEAKRLQGHLEAFRGREKTLQHLFDAHSAVDAARDVIFGHLTKTGQLPMQPAKGHGHEGFVSELPGMGMVKFVPTTFTAANVAQKDKFKKKKKKKINEFVEKYGHLIFEDAMVANSVGGGGISGIGSPDINDIAVPAKNKLNRKKKKRHYKIGRQILGLESY